MNIHEVKMSVGKTTRESLEKVGSELARVGRGAAAGLIAGAIAAYVMNRYAEIENRPLRLRKVQQAREANCESVPIPEQSTDGSTAPAVQVAQRVSRKLFDHELSDLEKKAAGPAVHYGYAAGMGALYGGLAEVFPDVGSGFGVPFATLMWLGGDEIALPAMGITDPPHRVAAEKHAAQLSKRFVYGLTLDIGRRILRRLI